MWLRIGICALGLAASAAQAGTPKPSPPAPAARSAEHAGIPASYRTSALGHGYGARGRHMADCLASYRGYDPATDLVTVRPGVTRRCEL